MKTIVAIFTEDGGQRYQIGAVMLNGGPEIGDDMDKQMTKWYGQFKSDCPTDEDGDFADWLVGKKFAQRTPMEVTYAVIDS